ncbi:hypothetical protein NZK32_08935 [Cyanobium sp. FGCU-52]|nr:hypothetical protein [Cyanobium sp. FGCU52]
MQLPPRPPASPSRPAARSGGVTLGGLVFRTFRLLLILTGVIMTMAMGMTALQAVRESSPTPASRGR